MIRVGVVGLGTMGQNHVRLYSELKCELVGVADSNINAARLFGEKYGIAYFTDHRQLLPMVDAVSIAVPTSLHHTVALDFLNRGIHCLVEKPIAAGLDESKEMVHAAEKNSVKLAVGHIERFNPAVIKLKQILDSGILGDLLIISTRRVGPFIPRIRDVGIVVDSATHDIGIANYLVGVLPQSVYAKVGSLKHPKEDHAIIVLDYGKTVASIEVNWFTPHKVRTLVATGSDGIAYLDYIEQSLVVHNSNGPESTEIKKAEPLKLEIEDFLNSIIENRSPAVDGKAGINILSLALEATGETKRESIQE